MANPHATVKYVEPNMILQDWRVNDEYDRAPRLEDYCIAMNIEVEISSRDTESTNKDVILMQWKSDKTEKVSFMAGTKIGGYEYNGLDRKARIAGGQQNLTTYYADMYVGDLIDYGTTEMIGIKSVNIEYVQTCVPTVMVQFTDVRGLSLFQPTELSRDNSYNGIKGLNKDNIAQSFFQCFFRMPLPRFTIYLKGFYGNPVSYEVMCDKFDTNFNSDTGDFDVTARFIGFKYSFLTDVSFDVLYLAPYSDFLGQKYWDDQVANGRFFLWDKYHTHKMNMPTLFEIHKDIQLLVNSTNEEQIDTTLTDEEKTHSEELALLNEIRTAYTNWYSSLFELLKQKYGKKYCFGFRENPSEENSDWNYIVLLTNSKTVDAPNLSEAYKQFSDDFKQINDNLYSKIENFNKSDNNYKQLKNISKDFSEYSRVSLFNNCFVNKNTRKIEFGGFSPKNKLPKTQVTNNMFHSPISSSSDETLKEYTLSAIYGDGVDQYIDAYVIEVDYSDLGRRIEALTLDSKKSVGEKEREKLRKEHNREMLSKMTWFPSIENFTKVMMAHLETYMYMMYQIQDMAKGRTPSQLGISIGEDGDACDVRGDSKTVPPFPRVTKKEVGEDGITKTLDSWVGEYDNGKGFVEADFINGLFNAESYVEALEAELERTVADIKAEKETGKPKPLIKHPLTSFDFFLTSSPYGTEDDISNNPNAFAGKVAMRMFNILAINNFKKQYNQKWSDGNSDFIQKLGEIEAENFYNLTSIKNKNLLTMLSAEGENGTITKDSILHTVTGDLMLGINNSGDIPWKRNEKDDNLFTQKNGLWLSRYTTSNANKTSIFPMQNASFSKLDESLAIFNKNHSIDFDNNDIIVDSVEYFTPNQLIESNNSSCFGSIFISDDYKIVSEGLDESNSSADDIYKEVYEILHDGCVLNSENFKTYILKDGVFRPKLGLVTDKKICWWNIGNDADSLNVFRNRDTKKMQCRDGEEISYSFESGSVDTYVTDVENGNIGSWFFTECRGFTTDNKGNLELTKNVGLFQQKASDKKYDNGKTIRSFPSDLIANISGGTYSTSDDKDMAFFLMGLETIDYSELAKHLNSDETFTYMPKLALLQIGAALITVNGIKDVIEEEKLKKKLPLPKTFNAIIPYLNRISYFTRIGYIKYYKEWVKKYRSEIIQNLNNVKPTECNIACIYTSTYANADVRRRALFREDSLFTDSLSNNLMSAVLVAKGNVNHYNIEKDGKGGVSSAGLAFSSTSASKYLEGFLKRLRELYSIKVEESGGDSVKLAKSPEKTTDDMKKELYRYSKLVYDKWIPSQEFNTWKYDTFFTEGSGDTQSKNENGHLFHFIDSFYNKIGDKLLVNPLRLSEKIHTAREAHDVNTMMLGFMGDIYSQNKCMLMCIQNFLDLADDKAMNAMFKPIPYNEMPQPRKNPDFVVLYPYEPSKYLNVDNGEYTNDAFMLNEEDETPIAIRSRGEDTSKYYKIPAFGVSYGKQYQSYFKKVKVGMDNPIATQQSIMAKHAILRQSKDSRTKSVVGQDLYDIYASQSYTCSVEMMGCAWVQPLMYFVLTNVPMFRGSYLIFKVTHNITPGNMVTEFQGTRMANVSNKLVEDIFTDEAWENEPLTYETRKQNELADVDNDCPYKVYPLWESNSLGKDEMENANRTMKLLMHKPYEFTKAAAAGVCGNIYKESTWKLHALNGLGAFGLCQWLGDRKALLIKKYGNMPTFEQQIEYINYEWDNEVVAKGHKADLMGAKTPENAAYIVRKFFERPGKAEADDSTRQSKASLYYKNYKETSDEGSSDKSQPSQDVNKKDDVKTAFFNAIKKSCNSTPSISVELKREDYNNGNIMMITQANGKNDKLGKVFDVILNGYYNYVQSLWWVYPKNGLRGNPSHIDVIVSTKPNTETRTVLVAESGNITASQNRKFGANDTEINDTLLKAIWKKFREVPNKEIPQFDNQDIFKNVKIENCNTLMNEEFKGQGSNSTWAKSVETMGKWYQANIHTYQGSNPSSKGSGKRRMYNCDLINGQVGDDCSGFVSACLQYFGVFKKGYVTNSKGFNGDTKVGSILENGNFKKMKYTWDTVEPYDIIAYNGHVEILAEKGDKPKSWGWGSVHDGLDGRASMPAATGKKPKGDTYKTIWRYVG